MSARTSSQAWDLRCHVREKLITFLQREHGDKLPRLRTAVEVVGGEGERLGASAVRDGRGLVPD